MEWASPCFSAIPEMDLDVTPPPPKSGIKIYSIKRITCQSHSGVTSKSITSKAQYTKILEELFMALGFFPEIDLDDIRYTSFLPPPPPEWFGNKNWDVILLRRMDSDEFWPILNQLWKWLANKTWDVILLRRMDSDEFWTILNQLWK